MKRTDMHRPTEITPADYEFVCHESIKLEGIGACEFILAEREALRRHMERTGGTYSHHAHGGNCMVCGNANAVYTMLFYHAKTNTYIRMGATCAMKCEMGDQFAAERFRKLCADARDQVAGKRKAEALLGDWGLQQAWVLYNTKYDDLPINPASVVAPRMVDTLSGMRQEEGYAGSPYTEEITVRDMVSKLVKFGSMSDKAQAYLRSLLQRIAGRAAKLAERESEKAAAALCPTGRMEIAGTVLMTRTDATDFGMVHRMLVVHETGYKVWGTNNFGAQRGDKVLFTATVEPSAKDNKFGFYKRPAKGVVVSSISIKGE